MKSTRSPMVAVGKPNNDGIPVSAVIADLGAVDHDGDTYDPGAFRRGTQIISPWGHASMSSALPVGTGTITEKSGMAIFDGVLFPEMQAARDLAAWLKRRGANQPWSYGFDVLDSRKDYREGKSVRVIKSVEAYEVSPVWKAAGVGTETLSLDGTMMKLSLAQRISEFKRRHNEYWSSERYHDNCARCDDRDHEFAILEKAQLTVIQWELEKSR